jgi:cathepsin L
MPGNTYKLGITVFADMTAEEFKSRILMPDLPARTYADSLVIPEGRFAASSLEEIDWTAKGAVSAVKNQGQCGSCWSFSTTGALESSYFLEHKQMMSFSEQQLVDCCGAKGFGCQGCSGAWPEDAMNYVNKFGIMGESEYPYTARDGQCKNTDSAKKILNASQPWSMVRKGDVDQLANALKVQPISICVDASRWSLYKSGVFNNCKTQPLDHAVLLVGVAADGTWRVKNSWSTGWGESGYIRLSPGNTCGVAEHAISVHVV